VFACDDFDYFHDMTIGIDSLHWYGTMKGELTGSIIKSEPFLQMQIEKGFEHKAEIDTHLVGAYNIYNVLAACAIGKYFDVPSEDIVTAIQGI
jgi:UDP-N-acetylmuramoyl-tripeptide--D-alanyl-D-alanine ligase